MRPTAATWRAGRCWRRSAEAAMLVLCAMLPVGARADICVDKDVRQMLEAAKAQEAYTKCQMKDISAAYSSAASSFADQVELLSAISVTPPPAPSPNGDGPADGATDGGSSGNQAGTDGGAADQTTLDVQSLRTSISVLTAINWSQANAIALAKDQITASFGTIQQLSAPFSSKHVTDYRDADQLKFCGAMLHWKMSKLWHDRFLACNP